MEGMMRNKQYQWEMRQANTRLVNSIVKVKPTVPTTLSHNSLEETTFVKSVYSKLRQQ